MERATTSTQARLRSLKSRRLLTVFVGSCLLTSASGRPSLQPLDDFYFVNDRRVEVTVFTDSLGVLLRDGVPISDLRSLAAGMGLTFVRSVGDRLGILTPSHVLGRMEAVELARDVRLRGDEIVAQSGFLVLQRGAEVPTVVTDQLIAQFRAGVTEGEVDSLNSLLLTEIVARVPFVDDQYVLAIGGTSGGDALTVANQYHREPLVRFAHPNFVHRIEWRDFIPTDQFFSKQWHLHNTGQDGGTVDADIDAPKAWDITRGVPAVTIAVLDGGFDLGHPDFPPSNLVHGNGFVGCDSYNPVCPDNDPVGDLSERGGRHGTAVAGVAVARNNGIGVVGSCPECSLMALRMSSSPTSLSLAAAFNYARSQGAHVISASWGFPNDYQVDQSFLQAIENAADAGIPIFFAMTDSPIDNCVGTPDISSLEDVIAVSWVTNKDLSGFGGYGDCMDILAPAGRSTSDGTLWGTTTDVRGSEGYNSQHQSSACPTLGPTANLDYTFCSTGTSFATPVAAGVAGLLLSVNPFLSGQQIQRLLQDTSDKVHDSEGRYLAATGFSEGTGGVATHGWGRINAFEAVRIAAPTTMGGKGGVDVFFRDNRLDWGNTERPSSTVFDAAIGFLGFWESQDIKLDAPPYQPAPRAWNFDSFIDESPSIFPGDVNRVYVRVRNRGPVTASTVAVKVVYSQIGSGLMRLPDDFWTAFPGNSSETSTWVPLNCSTGGSACTVTNLHYSGSTIAGSGTDPAQIVRFDFPAPNVSPGSPSQFCVLAIMDSPQDRAMPLPPPARPADHYIWNLTPNDNNITQRNYAVFLTLNRTEFSEPFFVRNALDTRVWMVLRLKAPRGWRVELDGFEFFESFQMDPGQEALTALHVQAPDLNAAGEVTIIQELVDGSERTAIGGVTFRFAGATSGPLMRPAESDVLTPYLVGTYDLEDGASTEVLIANPTARQLGLLVALFGSDGRPLTCIQDRIEPNGLLEIDVASLVSEGTGVIKVISFDALRRLPESGVVGYTRHTNGDRAGETVMRAVAEPGLQAQWEVIRDMCSG